jgi:precorrin-6B methylase 2
MNVEEAARLTLAEILGVGQPQTMSATMRITQITNVVLRFRSMWLGSLVASKNNLVVPDGPFVGMRSINVSAGSSIVPKLIGSYEAELHDTIRELACRGYERVVNIGCGEGYYAVGLARLLPAAHVFALDSESAARTLCHSLAELNEVAERVTIMGQCTPTGLQELAQPGTLIFCDCEGGELELLDPVAVPNLSRCDILVEMHDFLRPETSATLETRFRSTHTTRVIPQSSRDPQAYPILESFSEFDRLLCLCEHRPGSTPWGLFLSNTQALRETSEAVSADLAGE